jgi:glutathione S-transferase
MTQGTLYGTPPSRASRVLWLATELGISLEVKPVDIFAGQHKTPEFASVNVLEQVPAFTDGTVSIGESLAINLYLARKHGGPVSGQNLAEEAEIYQWTMIAAGVDPQVAPIMTHRIVLPPDKRDEREAQKALRAVKRTLAGVERHLSRGNQWLVGGRFTVADLNLAAASQLLHFTGLAPDVGPSFAGWLARCLARPGAEQNFKPPMPPPPAILERLMKMMAAN